MKISILYICIGKYTVFWEDFFESCERRFLPKYEKHYFVFTDAPSLYYESQCPRIHRIHQENLGWPYNTLMRFAMFSSIKKQLEGGG